VIGTELSPPEYLFAQQANNNMRQKKPIMYFMLKSKGVHIPKLTNHIERSLILLHRCNSSNPHGEKCETTTEKGAASKTVNLERTSLLPNQRSTGDLPTLDDLKSEKNHNVTERIIK